MTDAQESTDLVLAAPAAMGPPNPAEWGALKEQIEFIVRANALPAALRGKPADLMLVMLTGRELGIGPVQAIAKLHVIDGKPTMSAELMLALVLRAGHECSIAETTNERCVVRARRRGQAEPTEFTFTMDDAKAASLSNKDVWKKYPANMLRARCISNACRMVFPDVLMGVSYVPEEVGADVDPFTGEVTPPVEELIHEADVIAFTERIRGLSDVYRNQLRDTMIERGWVLKRLPTRLREAFLTELEGLEAWEPVKRAATDDGEPVEGVVVGADAEVEDTADGAVTDAEVVDHDEDSAKGEGPAGQAAGDRDDAIAAAPTAPPPAGTPPEGPVGDDGDRRDESESVPVSRPAQGSGPAPAPDAPAPVTRSQLARIAATCNDLADEEADVSGDHYRHALVYAVTDGRTKSAADLTKLEASTVIEATKDIKAGMVRLEITGEAENLAELVAVA